MTLFLNGREAATEEEEEAAVTELLFLQFEAPNVNLGGSNFMGEGAGSNFGRRYGALYADRLPADINGGLHTPSSPVSNIDRRFFFFINCEPKRMGLSASGSLLAVDEADDEAVAAAAAAADIVPPDSNAKHAD